MEVQVKKPIMYIYPTLLDSFTNYQNCDSIWEKYYGNSEEPSITLADFEKKSFNELIDKINRVKTEPSKAASAGTAFNDIVDTLIHNKVCGRTELGRVYSQNDYKSVIGISGLVDGFGFNFDYQFCKDAADYFKGSTSQVLVEANIDTKYGVVNLYGFIDELNEDVVYDIKTTSRYDFGKYANYWQRHIYPYCLIESGMMKDVRMFEFTAYGLKNPTKYNPLISGTQYRESYNYNHQESTKLIQEVLERFLEFLDANKALITNDLIFTEHKHE